MRSTRREPHLRALVAARPRRGSRRALLGPGMADEHRIARSLLGLAPGDGVLDVACGPGNFSRDFARAVGDDGPGRRHRRIAADARAGGPRDRRNAASTTSSSSTATRSTLPFRDSSFDAVCCFAALHLFAEPLEALDHMTRGARARRADRDLHDLPRAARGRCGRSSRRVGSSGAACGCSSEDEIVEALRAARLRATSGSASRASPSSSAAADLPATAASGSVATAAFSVDCDQLRDALPVPAGVAEVGRVAQCARFSQRWRSCSQVKPMPP